MGENEGKGLSSETFKKLTVFTREHDSAFNIGSGMHLDGNKNQEFLSYIKDNNWWKTRFFPNISTYENEYYGSKYSDWDKGKKIIESLKFPTYSQTSFFNDKADYYTQIKEGFYTIHLFQLHNHEREQFDSVKTDMLKWLLTEIEAINKSETDFIIISGRGIDRVLKNEVHEDNYNKVLSKADLIISDDFLPFKLSSSEEMPNGAVTLNSGAVNSNSKYTPSGFVQIFHLPEPSAFVILYLNAEEDEFRLPSKGRSYIKYVNGPLAPLTLRDSEETEMPERVICDLPEDYTQSRVQFIAEKLFNEVDDCDRVWIKPESGLEAGQVQYKDLWDVFPKNGEVYVLNLTYQQLRKIFGKEIQLDNHKNQSIAIGSYFGDFIIERFNLTPNKYTKTGKHEIELLEEFLKSSYPPKVQAPVQE
jgi:hypothetical protein